MAIRKPTTRTPAKPQRAKARPAPHNVWKELAEIGRRVPTSEWDKLPRDLSKNFDHYAHGSPRES